MGFIFPLRGFIIYDFTPVRGGGGMKKDFFFFFFSLLFYFNANLPKNILFKYTQNSIQDKICWQRKTNNVCLTLSGRIAEYKDESSIGSVYKAETFIGAVNNDESSIGAVNMVEFSIGAVYKVESSI